MENNMRDLINTISAKLSYGDVLAAEQLAKISTMILKARIDKGMTQKELSEKTGITQADISRLENGNANPDADITRQDMAVVLHRASAYCEIALDKVNSRAVFEDKEEISDYAVESVEELQQAGIINGNGSGSFMPMAFATRAEAAKMICCLADLTEM